MKEREKKERNEDSIVAELVEVGEKSNTSMCCKCMYSYRKLPESGRGGRGRAGGVEPS